MKPLPTSSPTSTTALMIMLIVLPAVQAEEQAQERKLPIAANSLGMQFVRVPAGEYLRGFDTSDRRDHDFFITHSYSNRQEFKNETPSHRVAITKPFEIATTEVTVGQFRAFVQATNYTTDAETNGGAMGFFANEKDYVDRFRKSPDVTWKSPGFEQSEEHPVVAISWNDAEAFCRWLSERENVHYRLPSEAEWEYACRANQKTWYSWGKDPDEAYSHANVADGALETAHPNTTRYQRAVRLKPDEGDGTVFTAKTASYLPNPWGLHDMHGNVWEWCQDRWSADLYERYFDDVPRQKRSDVIVRDPLFLDETDQHAYGDWRSIRGGGWTCAPAAVRNSIRTYAESSDATVYTGFRLVRD